MTLAITVMLCMFLAMVRTRQPKAHRIPTEPVSKEMPLRAARLLLKRRGDGHPRVVALAAFGVAVVPISSQSGGAGAGTHPRGERLRQLRCMQAIRSSLSSAGRAVVAEGPATTSDLHSLGGRHAETTRPGRGAGLLAQAPLSRRIGRVQEAPVAISGPVPDSCWDPSVADALLAASYGRCLDLAELAGLRAGGADAAPLATFETACRDRELFRVRAEEGAIEAVVRCLSARDSQPADTAASIKEDFDNAAEVLLVRTQRSIAAAQPPKQPGDDEMLRLGAASRAAPDLRSRRSVVDCLVSHVAEQRGSLGQALAQIAAPLSNAQRMAFLEFRDGLASEGRSAMALAPLTVASLAEFGSLRETLPQHTSGEVLHRPAEGNAVSVRQAVDRQWQPTISDSLLATVQPQGVGGRRMPTRAGMPSSRSQSGLLPRSATPDASSSSAATAWHLRTALAGPASATTLSVGLWNTPSKASTAEVGTRPRPKSRPSPQSPSLPQERVRSPRAGDDKADDTHERSTSPYICGPPAPEDSESVLAVKSTTGFAEGQAPRIRGIRLRPFNPHASALRRWQQHNEPVASREAPRRRTRDTTSPPRRLHPQPPPPSRVRPRAASKDAHSIGAWSVVHEGESALPAGSSVADPLDVVSRPFEGALLHAPAHYASLVSALLAESNDVGDVSRALNEATRSLRLAPDVVQRKARHRAAATIQRAARAWAAARALSQGRRFPAGLVRPSGKTRRLAAAIQVAEWAKFRQKLRMSRRPCSPEFLAWLGRRTSRATLSTAIIARLARRIPAIRARQRMATLAALSARRERQLLLARSRARRHVASESLEENTQLRITALREVALAQRRAMEAREQAAQEFAAWATAKLDKASTAKLDPARWVELVEAVDPSDPRLRAARAAHSGIRAALRRGTWDPAGDKPEATVRMHHGKPHLVQFLSLASSRTLAVHPNLSQALRAVATEQVVRKSALATVHAKMQEAASRVRAKLAKDVTAARLRAAGRRLPPSHRRSGDVWPASGSNLYDREAQRRWALRRRGRLEPLERQWTVALASASRVLDGKRHTATLQSGSSPSAASSLVAGPRARMLALLAMALS